jgi:single-stranded-DNA-specific exonuclease
VPAREPVKAFRIEPYAYSEARALADALDLSEPVAVTLVRRGYRTVEAAREFLDADERHGPFEFEGMEEATALILETIRAGRRVTVHGDYDVDGVCSTVILIEVLRRLGADCDWYIPDRLGDGYGLTEAGVERVAARGTGLLLTADCGITCHAEVEAARRAGMEVIVTDHHAPGDQLPECPIVHPVVSGYTCAELCATGVAHKLSAALGERAGLDPGLADEDLDLVALATVADLVPLRGENRALVRRGLAEARRTRRAGLRALLGAAGVEPSRLDEGDLAFRLAPRINAAGRLYRADAGVELFLCDDECRAAEIATELDRANRERRDAELQALGGAEAALRDLPTELAEAPALVLAGAGWHPGVVGIVASRLVERHWRPVVLIGLDGRGAGRGSGRSIPSFDLLAGLRTCDEHLVRYGGHRAAAGLEIEASRVDAFREAFVAHAREALADVDAVRTEEVDAVVGGDRLGLDVAEDLERLGPFGMGNPGVRLLVPAARLRDVRPMGEGKHARFTLESGAARALGVAFGANGTLSSLDDEAADVSVELEINQWNGAIEPRVVLRDLYPVLTEAEEDSAGAACPERAQGEEWWRRLRAERKVGIDEWPPSDMRDLAGDRPPREVLERAPGSGVATVADLVSSGEPVLALCADVSRRRLLAEQSADPARFGGGPACLACGRCASEPLRARIDEVVAAGRGLVLADWAAVARDPGLPLRFAHVVLIDPPPFAHLEELAAVSPSAGSYLHVTWGGAETAFARRVHDWDWDLRPALAELYRALDEGGPAGGERLAEMLEGPGRHPRTPEHAGRCVRVLEELGLVEWSESAADPALRVVSSEGTELDRSSAFVAYERRCEEGRQFLSRQRQPHASRSGPPR